MRLYSQPAISDRPTKHREDIVSRRSYVRSYFHSTRQNTRVPVCTPLRLRRNPAFGVWLLLRRDRFSARLGPSCPLSPSHCGWLSESSSPPPYNRRFLDTLVHVNDADVRASVYHGCRLEVILLRQVCTHRVYDRMGAPTSTVIKHRVNERRKPSAVLFAEQQKSNIPAQCR